MLMSPGVKVIVGTTVLSLMTSIGTAQPTASERERMTRLQMELMAVFQKDVEAEVSLSELAVPERMRARLDGNEDGVVTFAEFEKAFQGRMQSSLPRDRSDFTRLSEDGFPLNVNPEIRAASEVDLADDDMVMGVRLNGEARAYPVNYMNGPFNEVVNDRLGGKAIAPSW